MINMTDPDEMRAHALRCRHVAAKFTGARGAPIAQLADHLDNRAAGIEAIFAFQSEPAEERPTIG